MTTPAQAIEQYLAVYDTIDRYGCDDAWLNDLMAASEVMRESLNQHRQPPQPFRKVEYENKDGSKTTFLQKGPEPWSVEHAQGAIDPESPLRHRHVVIRDHDGLIAFSGSYLAMAHYYADELQRSAIAREQSDDLADACEMALRDLELVNSTLVKAARVHPFTLTPKQLRAALEAAGRQPKE